MERPGECVEFGRDSNLLGTEPERPLANAGRCAMDDAVGNAVSLSRSVNREELGDSCNRLPNASLLVSIVGNAVVLAACTVRETS